LLEQVEKGPALDVGKDLGGAIDQMRLDGSETTSSIEKGLIGDDAAEYEACEV
jgi:hypothetical protein